jgi:hypothetical protein
MVEAAEMGGVVEAVADFGEVHPPGVAVVEHRNPGVRRV